MRRLQGIPMLLWSKDGGMNFSGEQTESWLGVNPPCSWYYVSALPMKTRTKYVLTPPFPHIYIYIYIIYIYIYIYIYLIIWANRSRRRSALGEVHQAGAASCHVGPLGNGSAALESTWLCCFLGTPAW